MDKQGSVDRISLYNTDHKLRPKHLLPTGAIFAIKDPFYEGAINGGTVVRVDHPSDLIRLPSSHPLLQVVFCPRLVERENTAEAWKVDDNAAYKEKDYCTAVFAYTQGLSACSIDETRTRCDSLHDRDIVNLCLQRYEQALVDAEACLLPGETGEDTVRDGLHEKAYFQVGRAAYELAGYGAAHENYQAQQALSPDDKHLLKQLRRTAARLAEQNKGEYDFKRMSKSVGKEHNRLDHASFTLRM